MGLSGREELLRYFVAWATQYVTGDEKGEAQIFLDHLFRAFGQRGSLDVGGTAEMRIRKSSEGHPRGGRPAGRVLPQADRPQGRARPGPAVTGSTCLGRARSRRSRIG